VTLYARAVRDDPTEQRFRDLGDAASHAGLHAQAADAFDQALAKHGSPEAELVKKAREERELAGAALHAPLAP
jgi:hypothetical protein